MSTRQAGPVPRWGATHAEQRAAKFWWLNPVTVVLIAVVGGPLAGVLYIAGAVVFVGGVGGLSPFFYLGAAGLIALLMAVALASAGSAVIVYIVFARFSRGRVFIVSVCAVVAALVGGGAGLVLNSNPGGWIFAALLAAGPAAYVAVTFPRLHRCDD